MRKHRRRKDMQYLKNNKVRYYLFQNNVKPKSCLFRQPNKIILVALRLHESIVSRTELLEIEKSF